MEHIVSVNVADLKFDPDNARVHPEDNLDLLVKSLQSHGQPENLVVQKSTMHVIAGNGRLEAMRRLGWTTCMVNLKDWSDEECRRYSILANRTGELSSWNLDVLERQLNDMPESLELEDLGFDEDALSEMFVGGEEKTEQKDNIEVSEDVLLIDVEKRCERGDIWRLGKHRIMCGDSTTKDVDTLLEGKTIDLVFTDPPYGMRLDTAYAKMTAPPTAPGIPLDKKAQNYRPVIGDDADFDPRPLLRRFASVKEVFLWGADYYCQHLPREGSWVVWDKRTRADGESIKQIIGSSFELCWSKTKHAREIARILWSGLCQAEKDGKRVHPTQKPVMLAEWFFERWAKEANTVADLYGGSGSTLLACERQNKQCLMMEIDAQYCDVILHRWEKATNQKAMLLSRTDDAKDQEKAPRRNPGRATKAPKGVGATT